MWLEDPKQSDRIRVRVSKHNGPNILAIDGDVAFEGLRAAQGDEYTYTLVWPAHSNKHATCFQERVETLVAGNTDFALKLYQQLRVSQSGNLFFSPYSISTALAMLYAGAKGDTEAQMAACLNFSLPQKTVHSGFNYLELELHRRAIITGTLPEEETEIEFEVFKLNISNAVWMQQGYPVLSTYLDHLALPKWQYRSNFNLKKILNDLGMTDLFLPQLADLSGINGFGELYAQNVFHEAFVKVNEAGTEAAAATGIPASGTGVPPIPEVVHIDRPFILLVYDQVTQTVIFMGRVIDPGRD